MTGKSREVFSVCPTASCALEEESMYYEERPHMALKGKTPREFLTEKLKNHVSKQALLSPIKSVQEVC